jgi:hypothetical protein
VLLPMSSIRSERYLFDRLKYDVLLRSFLDLRIDQPALDASTLLQEPPASARSRRGRMSSSQRVVHNVQPSGLRSERSN